MKGKIKLLMIAGLFALNGVSGAMIPPQLPADTFQKLRVEKKLDPGTIAVLENVHRFILNIQNNQDALGSILENAYYKDAIDCFNASSLLIGYNDVDRKKMQINNTIRSIIDCLVRNEYLISDNKNRGKEHWVINLEAPRLTEESMIKLYFECTKHKYPTCFSSKAQANSFASLKSGNLLWGSETVQLLENVYKFVLKYQDQIQNNLRVLNAYLNIPAISNEYSDRISNRQEQKVAIMEELSFEKYLVYDFKTKAVININPDAPKLTEKVVINAYRGYMHSRYDYDKDLF